MKKTRKVGRKEGRKEGKIERRKEGSCRSKWQISHSVGSMHVNLQFIFINLILRF
jgi:hypothetical protein